MTQKELEKIRSKWMSTHIQYKMIRWDKWDYKILNNIMYSIRIGNCQHETFSNAIIMADTETSKKKNSEHNHVVAFTVSIRAFEMNIVTLWGHTPEDFCHCLQRIRQYIQGDKMVVFWHNLPYDWVFCRKFMFKHFGTPVKQMNIKPHYPLFITFDNGIQFRDSLILAQRSLEKWAKDLQVEHQKAVGKWDYEKYRNQSVDNFSDDELEYIEHDTLAGVECINTLMNALHKKLWGLPYTATGIPREEVRKRGKANNAKELFNRTYLELETYHKMLEFFHGGYVHANRHLIDDLIETKVQCFDFASSYPFVLLTRKYPMEKFAKMDNCKMEKIVKSKENTAFIFKAILTGVELKNDFTPMPVLQQSKCVKSVNVVADNGRILKAAYVEIWLNEIDAALILEQYKIKNNICIEVEYARKDYLPRWFTDYIFELFTEKCKLKGGDPVLYALAKAKLNALYGLCVQKSIKPQLEEVLVTSEKHHEGDYVETEGIDEEEQYNKYLRNKGNILNFSWGCWCTSYAMENLFRLGSCIIEDGEISHWIYSDTDSCYSDSWDYEKIAEYNEQCKKDLAANGYGAVVVNGKEYWLGIAEHKEGEDDYTQFKVQGAKRYAGRCVEDGQIHITVAGVPKKTGAKCLEDDLNKFTQNFIFSGSITGKLTHKYFFIDEIYTDEEGNVTGDSIDLTPCDYRLDSTPKCERWWEAENEEIEYQIYE